MKTSIFIVPRASSAWRGNEAGWITASGWASAGKHLWGEALVATRDGVFSPEEARLFPRGTAVPQRGGSWWRKLIPEVLITALKDYQLWRSVPPAWPIESDQYLKDRQVALIWERHDLFPGPGRRLATRLGVPLITSVEAVVVWEAEKWGVKRPLFGRWLEQGEGASLRQSDLVLCVSEKVRQKVISLGVDPGRAMVTPNRVDSTLFNPGVSGDAVRKRYGLEGKTIIGWTGSFRKFHGLPDVIAAFEKIHRQHASTVLMLVGDGQELESIRKLADEVGISTAVLFPGRQPFTAIPSFVAAFDIGLVTAAAANDFHYSPLKLREYLAVGKAIVAPRVGDLPALFREDVDLLLYPPGGSDELAGVLSRILADPELKGRLEARARELFLAGGTWVHELTRVCAHLGMPINDTMASTPQT